MSTVLVQYSYNLTIPKGRAEFTEPQFLYSTRKFLFRLWTVRSLKNLYAGTEQLKFYSLYRPYRICLFSMPSQYIYISTPL